MFATTLAVNIEHINYGEHLAHDKLISLMHEARLRFFDHLGQSELDFYGISLILKTITVDYRQEAFRGDLLTFALTIRHISRSAFTLHYEIRNQHNEAVADAEVVLLGFDYGNRQVAHLPDLCRQALVKKPIDDNTRESSNEPLNQNSK